MVANKDKYRLSLVLPIYFYLDLLESKIEINRTKQLTNNRSLLQTGRSIDPRKFLSQKKSYVFSYQFITRQAALGWH